eukprot:15133221-Heterocapsa_arctica.AAC.1
MEYQPTDAYRLEAHHRGEGKVVDGGSLTGTRAGGIAGLRLNQADIIDLWITSQSDWRMGAE